MYNVKRLGYENYLNDHQGESVLIFSQILSTYSLEKCIEISLENLLVDIGALRVKLSHEGWWT